MALVSAGCLALASACGLTADFSGLQGGTRPATDSGADGRSSDSGPPFCASLPTHVKLCADFDEGKPLDDGWGATDLYGGEAARVDTVAYSLPGSFLSAVNPSGAPASARLLQTVPTQSPHVHVAFEMLLTPSDGNFELCVLHEVTPGGVTYGLYYKEVASKLVVQLRTLDASGAIFDQTWPLGDPPPRWTRVDIDADIAASGSFAIRHDGIAVVSQTNVPTSTPSRSAMFVELGVFSYAPGTGQANFDDVIIDWP